MRVSIKQLKDKRTQAALNELFSLSDYFRFPLLIIIFLALPLASLFFSPNRELIAFFCLLSVIGTLITAVLLCTHKRFL
ncbi:hypothetical protein GJU40_02815 [Bacillus lacus]|uniref:Uncharacterized protein n=1 Tax=Metabacillus lacus TaxID=1983721 RepID=A0A7X2IWH8_9BACI|nr:hypothetical protein [Metabacillus lacus]MRX71101.1 hypothetical protein [Metabacillus lacus]